VVEHYARQRLENGAEVISLEEYKIRKEQNEKR
jgi:hypothetical protein